MEKDNLTVVIICRNAAEFLPDCFASLAPEEMPFSCRVLFIDDASTDNSFEIARDKSKRIKKIELLRNEHNQGIAGSCNKALGLLQTPYFIRLDADDYFSRNALKDVLKELNSAGKSDFLLFRRWDLIGNKAKEVDYSSDIYNWIAAGAAFSTDSVRSVGGYSNEYWEEYDLYVKLLNAGCKHRISPYRIYYYRRHQGGITRDYEKNKKGLESLLNKWGPDVLSKYGDINRILKYYNARAPHFDREDFTDV